MGADEADEKFDDKSDTEDQPTKKHRTEIERESHHQICPRRIRWGLVQRKTQKR